MPSGEFEVGTDDENPNLQPVPEQLLEENPSVAPPLQSSQPSEPPLPPRRRRVTTQQFERNVRARQSTSSACSLELACVSKKQRRKVGVEVSNLVTAKRFEKP